MASQHHQPLLQLLLATPTLLLLLLLLLLTPFTAEAATYSKMTATQAAAKQPDCLGSDGSNLIIATAQELTVWPTSGFGSVSTAPTKTMAMGASAEALRCYGDWCMQQTNGKARSCHVGNAGATSCVDTGKNADYVGNVNTDLVAVAIDIQGNRENDFYVFNLNDSPVSNDYREYDDT